MIRSKKTKTKNKPEQKQKEVSLECKICIKLNPIFPSLHPHLGNVTAETLAWKPLEYEEEVQHQAFEQPGEQRQSSGDGTPNPSCARTCLSSLGKRGFSFGTMGPQCKPRRLIQMALTLEFSSSHHE